MRCAFEFLFAALVSFATASNDCLQLQAEKVCFADYSPLPALTRQPLDLNTLIAVKPLWQVNRRLALSMAVSTDRDLSKGWQMNFNLTLDTSESPITVLQLNGLQFRQTGSRIVIGNLMRSYYGIVYDAGFFQFTIECLLPPDVDGDGLLIDAQRLVRDLRFTVLDRPGSSAFDTAGNPFTFHYQVQSINGSSEEGRQQKFTASINIGGANEFIRIEKWLVEWQWPDQTTVIENVSLPAQLFTQQQSSVIISGVGDDQFPSASKGGSIWIEGRFQVGLQQPQGVRIGINGQPAEPILPQNIIID